MELVRSFWAARDWLLALPSTQLSEDENTSEMLMHIG